MNYTIKSRQFPPKTHKQLKGERRQFINEFLEGNLHRFLRKHYKDYHNELVYSVDFKKWEKQGFSDLVKLLKNNFTYPKHIVEIVNVTKTLIKHYNRKLSRKTIDVAVALLDMFEEDIYNYHRERYKKRYSMELPIRTIEPHKALKEQKARGYIHINKYEDFDRSYSHIYSNVNKDYVYPQNFPHDYTHFRDNTPADYIAITLVGVSGHTRIEYPLANR